MHFLIIFFFDITRNVRNNYGFGINADGIVIAKSSTESAWVEQKQRGKET